MAFRPESLGEEFSTVVVNLCPVESLHPVSFAVGAAPTLDDIEVSPCFATKLEELGLEFFLNLPLVSLGGRVNHTPFIGE